MAVGHVKAVEALLLRALADGLPLGSHLGQTDTGDANANQGEAGQINALGEYAAQYAQAQQRLVAVGEPRQEGIPRGFIHAALLHMQGQIAQLLRGGPHIGVGGEEGDVLARMGGKGGADGAAQHGQAILPRAPAGVDRQREGQQVLRREGGGQFKAGVLGLAAQQIAHGSKRVQRGGVAHKPLKRRRYLPQVGGEVQA